MSDRIVHMLERVLQPNGAFRQSPYIDALYWSDLTGSDPSLSFSWLSDEREQTAVPEDVLLAFPMVAQTQYAFLDLIRENRFNDELRILIMSHDSSSSAVAALDVLLLWWHLCHVYGVTFPVNDVHLRLGYMTDDQRYAGQDRIRRYSDILNQRAAMRDATDPIHTVAAWANQVSWFRFAGDIGNSLPDDQSDVVLLVEQGNRDLATEAVYHLVPGGSLVLLEPGTKERSVALARMRRTLLRDNRTLFAIGPCGQEFGNELPECCDVCWPVRSEYLDLPFGEQLLRSDHRRETDAGTMTTWSYAIIGKSTSDAARAVRVNGSSGALSGSFPQTRNLRFIGAFRGKDPVPAPERDKTSGTGRFFAKVCPADTGGKPAIVSCSPEILGRDLRFGERFDLTIQHQESRGAGLILYPQSPVNRRQRGSSNPGSSGFIPEPRPETVDSVNRGMDEIAFRLFRFPELREFQHVILTRVLAGKSTFGIAATGGGKSECFILPAMVMPGVTIVVSPLKSLMMDQYQERICRRYNLGDRVTWINGDLPTAEQRRRLELAGTGAYSLIYMTPEQLEKESTLRALRRVDERVGIRYLAVDEAHCVSQWGHDFRQSYLNTLRRMAEVGLDPVRIALTATASPAVRTDICQELNLDNRPVSEDGDVYIYSSNRPELNFITRVVDTRTDKVESIARELYPFRNGSEAGSAIVFMPWTEPKNLKQPSNAAEVSPYVSSMASYLERELRTRVSIYHSKMEETEEASDRRTRPSRQMESLALGDVTDRERGTEQNAFIRGERRIMVATKGFGMGIDKPDIRTVIHATPPGNLEAYVQEAGRAGRDGEPANVVLYYSYSPDGDIFSDFQIQQNFLEQKELRGVDVRGFARYLFARQRKEGTQLVLRLEDVRDYVNAYVRDQKLTEKPFQARRQRGVESAEHAMLLDRGYFYGEWAEYLHRLISELHAFAGLLQNDSGSVFFESANRFYRHRDPDVQSMTLEQRRERFGARFRAWPREANARARRAGRDFPDLDDWFGETELPWPVGWNVELGSAFRDPKLLTAFVDAFCDAHQQRYENARDSYTRLLTDYLGLHPDGRKNHNAEPECLRSVMLGYLKTNEIVHDGNCRSCSNCVPDERFDQYTVEERQNAVIRIDDEIQDVLEYLESTVDALPDAGPMEILLGVIKRNTQSAHALRRYIAGWTGRILDEQPEHVAARWLRLRMLDSSDSHGDHLDEFLSHLRNLAQHLGSADLPQLWTTLLTADVGTDAEANRVLWRLKARVANRLGYHDEEAAALRQIVDSIDDPTSEFDEDVHWIAERVRDLHAPSGALPDSDRYQWAFLQLARISLDEVEAMTNYASLNDHWSGADVIEELGILELASSPRVPAIGGLLRLWIDQNEHDPVARSAQLVQYLANTTPDVFRDAESETISVFLAVLRDEDLQRAPAVAEQFAIRLLSETSDDDVLSDEAARLLKSTFAESDHPTSEIAQVLARLIVRGVDAHEVDTLISDSSGSDTAFQLHLAKSVATQLPALDEKGFTNWLRVFPVELHLESPELSRTMIAALRSPVTSPDRQFDLSRMAANALFDGEASDALHRHWISLGRDMPGVLGEYIQDLLESQPPCVEWAERAFDQMLAGGELADVASFLQWANRSETVYPSSRITRAASLFDAITLWANARSESGAARYHTDRLGLQREFEGWSEKNRLQGVRNMDEADYRRILDLSFRRIESGSEIRSR